MNRYLLLAPFLLVAGSKFRAFNLGAYANMGGFDMFYIEVTGRMCKIKNSNSCVFADKKN